MKEITFEEIQKANETIMTLDVKGKQYAEVNQRIKAFRMLYPTGTITTDIVSLENGICVMRATITANGEVLGTGTAYEKENSTFINKTSYIENCETSAVGRALAMCGIGIDTSIASAEEVQNAINNQKEDQTKKLNLITRLNQLRDEVDCDYDALLKYYKVVSNADMTTEQLEDAIKKLEGKKK